MSQGARLVILAHLAACQETATDSGGTGLPPQEPRIGTFTAACLDDATYYGELIATATTSGVGVLNIWETGATAPVRNEEHDVLSSATGSFGELLEVTLVQTDDLVPEAGATGFSCAAGGPFLAEAMLTYAVRIYDEEGNLADCRAFGHAPSTVRDGTIDAMNTVSRPGELTGCPAE